MKGKQRPKNKKRPKPQTLSPNDAAVINSLLQQLEDSDTKDWINRIPSPQLAQIIIDRLPLTDASAVTTLKAFQEKFIEKIVQKAVKRALFRLQRKGFSIESFTTKDDNFGPVIMNRQEEAPKAFIGPVVDLAGYRPVIITMDRLQRGLDMAFGIVSDEEGIKEFLFGNYSRKKAREMKDKLSQDAGPLVETSLPHAAALLETGYQCHKEGRRKVPPDYIDFRPQLMDIVPHPSKDIVPKETSEFSEPDKGITQSQLLELFENEVMKAWIIDFEQLRSFIEEIHSVDNSPLVLTETQKAERIIEIKNKATLDLFPRSKRILLNFRLMEMSYFFAKSGNDTLSSLAYAASESMEVSNTALRNEPVIELIVERSFNFYNSIIKKAASEKQTKEEKSSGLIIT